VKRYERRERQPIDVAIEAFRSAAMHLFDLWTDADEATSAALDAAYPKLRIDMSFDDWVCEIGAFHDAFNLNMERNVVTVPVLLSDIEALLAAALQHQSLSEATALRVQIAVNTVKGEM